MDALTIQEVLASGVVRNQSYPTVSYGWVASYAGEGIVRKDGVWFWVQGHGPKGDKWSIAKEGWVEIQPVEDLTAFVLGKLEEPKPGNTGRYARVRKVFPADVTVVRKEGFVWTDLPDGSVEIFDSQFVEAVIAAVEGTEAITWKSAVEAGEKAIAHLWVGYWDYGLGEMPEPEKFWGVIPSSVIFLDSPTAGGPVNGTLEEVIADAKRRAEAWDREEKGDFVVWDHVYVLGKGYVSTEHARFHCK